MFELSHLRMSSESDREVEFVQTRQILVFRFVHFCVFFLYVQHKNSNIILSVSALWIRRRVWELIFLLLSDFESLWTHFQVVQIDGGGTITPRRENLLCRRQTINCKKNTNTTLNFYDGFQVEVEFYVFKRIKLMLKVYGGKSCCCVIGRPKQLC